MTFNKALKLFFNTLLLLGATDIAFADKIENPCGGPSALLNIVDRPTVSDSACVVPFKQTVMELGYQYQKLTHSAGYQQNIPEAVFRLGLPGN